MVVFEETLGVEFHTILEAACVLSKEEVVGLEVGVHETSFQFGEFCQSAKFESQ